MVTGIFTLLGVLVGFYLAKYLETNKAILEKAEDIKQKIQSKRYPSKVIKTDEVALEKEKQGKEIEKEKITLKDIFK